MKKENMENALTEVSDMYLQETVQTEERKKRRHSLRKKSKYSSLAFE